MSEARYCVTYASGATGYGWVQDADSKEEAAGLVEAVFSYSAYLDVYDRETNEFVYWKPVLEYKPKINLIQKGE